MTSPDQSQKVAGLGVPSAIHLGSRQSCSGPPPPRRGTLRARGTPAPPGHPPAARDGTRTMPKEPGEKSWHKTGSLAAGGRERGWCRARSNAGRALPATFHACLFLVFLPARRTWPQSLLFLVSTMPSMAQHLRFPPVSAAPRCPAWEMRIARGIAVIIPGGILIITLYPVKLNPLMP